LARAGSSRIRDAGLAPRGRALHDWAAARMGALRSAASSLGSRPLAGLTVAFCLQVTPETSVLVLEAMGLGARAVACAGNPHTTSDAIAAHLAASGATVHAWAGQGAREFAACARRAMDASPDIVVDDGAELSVLAHTRRAGPRIVGGTEETTTGVRRMRALFARHEARYPIIAVNDARTKATFDNAYGTGQSAVDALMRSCGLLVASRAAVVAGYGPVGRGVAARLGGLGARVIVTETDPVRALEARLDGHSVMRMSEAARVGDVFVTCTGQRGAITARHAALMRDGAILANVGHFDVEIDVAGVRAMAVRTRRPRANLEELTLRGGRRVLLVAGGYVANLVAAEGHAPEVMAMSFANQLRCIAHLARHAGSMEPGIHAVPREIDEGVARDALRAAGVRIDSPARRTPGPAAGA